MLQSMGSKRVGQDAGSVQELHIFICKFMKTRRIKILFSPSLHLSVCMDKVNEQICLS